MLIDTHCHLDYPDLLGNVDAVMTRAHAAGVRQVVTISTHVGRAESYRALSRRLAHVFWTVGTHPHNAAEEPDIGVDQIVAIAADERCVAIGEAGLDYHYDKSPRDIQRTVFRRHIEAARISGLPLVIHARDADDDMIGILSEESARGAFGAILHCFSSGAKLAAVGLELGFYISFSGIITFKRSSELREIAASVPLDRLLVETDAPYLAPEPFRGKPNEPSYIVRTAEALARVKGIDFDDMATATSENAMRVFHRMAQAPAAS